jgi:hypothetical protein
LCQRGTGNTIFPKTHNTLVYYRIPPPLPPHLLPPRPLAAVSAAAVSVAAVSAAATIAVSAAIAAAF